jgi:hypothetical protein
MHAAITGDIVNSRLVSEASVWSDPLKSVFGVTGLSSSDWEIYRGDSFQASVKVHQALRLALLIKCAIKKTANKELDVRMAIGIGRDEREGDQLSESMGEAFIFSGELLDELKSKKIHLGIRSPWKSLDKELNMMFRLALVIVHPWTKNTAEVAELLFSEPDITQHQIADRLGVTQSSVNERIKRGSVYEIIELEKYYNERLQEIIH